MPRPQAYYNAAGKRIPACTTITGRFGGKDGIIWWANAVGLGERDCDEQTPCRHCGRRAGKRHRDVKAAAEAGTYAHALIDQKVKGTTPEVEIEHFTQDQFDAVDRCMAAFDRWWEAYDVEVIETEFRCISEKYQFGGTLDMVGLVSGRFSLIDWKTSKGIYAEYLAQVAGYVLAVEEQGFPEIEEIDILRLSKETAAFEHLSFPRASFGPAFDWFKQAREMYDADKRLEALLK